MLLNFVSLGEDIQLLAELSINALQDLFVDRVLGIEL
jgi:hypothetical protein